MRQREIQTIFLLAAIAYALLFDTAFLFRMTLLCAFAHECGHLLLYILCTHKLPRLSFSAGGIQLHRTQPLSHIQALLVILAGPFFNLLCAVVLFCYAQYRASYQVYFFAAIHLCTAFYNLLPIGMLDGAQLCETLLPPQWLMPFFSFQRMISGFFSILCVLLAFQPALSLQFRLALMLAGSYIFAQGLLSRRKM